MPRAPFEEVDLEEWQRTNSSLVSLLTGGEEAEIRSLLARPEGKTLEFKRDLSSLSPVLKTLTAFANTAGGTLVVGRTNDGSLHGIPDAGKAEERLANAVADGIAPVLLPDIEAVRLDGADLLVVRVTRWPGPFYVKSEGPAQGIYVRLGSTNRRAGPEIAADLERAASHLAFDQLPCIGADLEDLDLDAIRRAFTAVGREIDGARLESLGVLTRLGRNLLPSNGGMILFGRRSARERLFPDALVRCARFAGPNKAEFLDRLDIEGSVLEALDETPRFIRRNTRMAARIESMHREDIPEYPRVALREALVNAVAHTDYTLRGMQIMVAVYSDRMEIQNPGLLAFGMTLDDLRAGVSRIRNPVIARVFRELGLMEKWGSGYKRMAEDCVAGGYPLPEWVELGPALRVVFRPHAEVVADVPDVPLNVPANVPLNVPANVPLNGRQSWFLEALRSGERLRAKDVAAHFGVSAKTAKRDVAALRKRGLVEFEGASRNGSYSLCLPEE
ncbi:MAG TPA: helix-turn-helix domain-containing protein [Thermoanaerobaculia bacterium]|nr:helix-turn-helix domain-containing protein [Thermoanaerobaculia bacterium]